jgi:hypothetical protein
MLAVVLNAADRVVDSPYLWYKVTTAIQYEIVPVIKHLGELELTSFRSVF